MTWVGMTNDATQEDAACMMASRGWNQLHEVYECLLLKGFFVIESRHLKGVKWVGVTQGAMQ